MSIADDEAEESTAAVADPRIVYGNAVVSPVKAFSLFSNGIPSIALGITPRASLASLAPIVKLPTFDFTPIFSGLTRSIHEAIGLHTMASNILDGVFAQQREQWNRFFDAIQSFVEQTYPPNWRGVKNLKLSQVKPILLEEGMPLVWVPSRSTLEAILAAPDARSRRRILGRRWQHVLDDCETVLQGIDHPSLIQHIPFAEEAASALRTGHTTAAQALAANLLDSIMRRNFSKSSARQITKHKKGDQFDIDGYKMRVACTLAPIWRAYAEYWQDKGDPIPRTFGRHPSAHAVSRVQYSRINAITALMLVTSLLRLLDVELDN